MPLRVLIHACAKSKQDHDLLNRLRTHLAPVLRGWGCEVREHLTTPPEEEAWSARVLLLSVVTPEYLASAPHLAAVDLALDGGATVVPLLLRHSVLADVGLSGSSGSSLPSPTLRSLVKLKALPESGQPITAWRDRDKAMYAIAVAIHDLLTKLNGAPREPRALPVLRVPVALTTPRTAERYVSRPQEERRALWILTQPFCPLVLQAPWRRGKATLLEHLLEQSEGALIRFDLRKLMASHPQLLAGRKALQRHLAVQLIDTFVPGPQGALCLEEFEQGIADETDRLTSLLEEHILPHHQRLLIVLENADQLYERDYLSDFFMMLVNWIERRDLSADPYWGRLRLVVTVSMDPGLLERADRSSSFLRSKIVRLPLLNREQVGLLATHYGYAPDDPTLDDLVALTAGHPDLCALFLNEAELREHAPLAQIFDIRKDVFALSLGRLRKLLHSQHLGDGLRLVLDTRHKEKRRPLSDAEYGYLYRIGLIERDEPGQERAVCPLYRDYPWWS